MKEKEGNTKCRIIKIATSLFYENGFDKVTILDICEAAGINKHTFYYHFKSKYEILKNLTPYKDEIDKEMFIKIIEAKNYVEQLWIFFEPMIKFATTSGPKILKQVYISNMTENISSLKLQKMSALPPLMLPIIQKGKDAGEFKTEIDNNMLILILIHMFHGIAFMWNMSDGGFDFRNSMRYVFESIFDVDPKYCTSDKSDFDELWESMIKNEN